MKTGRSRAVLLKSIPYGESDRIVTLLTEEWGKLSAIARGARKSSRRFAGSLEPYAVIEIELGRSRGSLEGLSEARLVRAFPGILRDLERMTVAASGLEIVREALPEHDRPDPRLLPAIEAFFELAQSLATPELRIAFTHRVLSLSGLSPNLASCGRCGREAPLGKAALFSAELGSVICRACGGGPFKLSGGLRGALAGAASAEWPRLAQHGLEPEALAIADAMTGAFVEHHLTQRLKAHDVDQQVRASRAQAEEKNSK